MLRRHFMTGLVTSVALPGMAAAYSAETYAPATWPDLRDSRDKVVLNFRASWSITCQIKEELITALLQENPGYRQLTFVDVDWDTFGPSVWVQERLRVKRRSTLVAFRGKSEITRIENEPHERKLRGFLDSVLAG